MIWNSYSWSKSSREKELEEEVESQEVEEVITNKKKKWRNK
jgi:hypothetical protein